MPVYEEKGKVNGQKRWYVRTYIEDENGNRKQVTKHNKDWVGRDGYWKAQQEENFLRKKQYNNFEEFTLNELFILYIDNISQTSKPSSVGKERDNYNLYIKPRLGHKKVFKIINKDIIDFHAYLNEQKIVITSKEAKRGIGEYDLSISYKQSIHTTLSSLLKFGCRYIGLTHNVASVVGNFKKPKGTKKKDMHFLTISQFNKYITFEQDNIYRTFYTILFYTGMRRGELLALTAEDVNFQTNEISIDKAINPKNGVLSTIPKTDKSNRTIKMMQVVADVLRDYIDSSGNDLFGLQKIKPTTLQRKCDRNCKQAEVKDNIRIHDFRHSFASLCINNGVPIEILSEYLGHENIATTLETYAHLYPNSQDKLINILNQRVALSGI